MNIPRQIRTYAGSRVTIFLVLVGLVMTASCAESVQPAQGGNSRLARSESMDDMLGDQPPTPKTLLAMADILAAQGKDKECEFVLSTCIREHPGFAPAYNSLAELQMRQGRVAKAAHVLSEALRRWPNDSVLLNNIGMCSLIRHDHETALEYFTRAAAQAPETEKYRANMATSLGMLGRDAEALALLRQILPEEEAVHNAEVLRKAQQKASSRSANGIPG